MAGDIPSIGNCITIVPMPAPTYVPFSPPIYVHPHVCKPKCPYCGEPLEVAPYPQPIWYWNPNWGPVYSTSTATVTVV